jgi:hypothetical protein
MTKTKLAENRRADKRFSRTIAASQAPGWQQRLHRDIIDTFVENVLARKFWKTRNDGREAVAP